MKQAIIMVFLMISILGKVDVGHAGSLDCIISMIGEDLYDFLARVAPVVMLIAMVYDPDIGYKLDRAHR